MGRKMWQNITEERLFEDIERGEGKGFGYKENVALILRSEEGRPQEEEFADVYSQKEIMSDKAAARALEMKFQKELERQKSRLSPEAVAELELRMQESKALEIITMQRGGDFGWFEGPPEENKKEATERRVHVSRTVRYDDFNGADGVIEWEPEDPGEESRKLVLAIDASISERGGRIEDKILRNRDYITKWRRGLTVKYYQSPVSGKKEPIEMAVPVVIGVGGKNVEGLINLFAQLVRKEEETSTSEAEMEGYREVLKELEEHPVQRVFLEEIRLQLSYYLDYLKGCLKKNPYHTEYNIFQDKIEKLLSKIESIITKKGYLVSSEEFVLQGLEKDYVFSAIQNFVAKGVQKTAQARRAA